MLPSEAGNEVLMSGSRDLRQWGRPTYMWVQPADGTLQICLETLSGVPVVRSSDLHVGSTLQTVQ